jgi:hypothetical protein
MVRGFKQAWSKLVVHCDCGADSLLRYGIELFLHARKSCNQRFSETRADFRGFRTWSAKVAFGEFGEFGGFVDLRCLE